MAEGDCSPAKEDPSIWKVVELLSPDIVLDLFMERNLFGDSTKIIVRDIRDVSKPSERNRAIHDTVSRDPRRYLVFKECLAATWQTDLLDALEKIEEDVHNEMIANGRCSICKTTDVCKIITSLKCNRDVPVSPTTRDADSVIRESLQRNISNVVNLQDPDVVLDQFMERNLFGDHTSARVRDIHGVSKLSEKNRAIYDTVSRDCRIYPAFKECLAATRQTGLLDALEKTEEEVHAEMIANRRCCVCRGTGACNMMTSLRCNRDIPEYISSVVRGTQNHLIALYNRHCQKVPVYPLIPEWREHVEQLYVKPTMIEMNPRGILTDQASRKKKETKLKGIRDIFYTDERSYRDVYVVAESGSGKSTLCEFLVYLWVKSHSATDLARGKSGHESFMEEFALLFYISLREANRNSTCDVEDMIKSQLELENVDVAKLILEYPCLIILDGLDEYSLKHSRNSRYISERLPWRRNSEKCTILTTSRPWKMELLASELGDHIDRQIRITGLESEAQIALAENVITLLNAKDEQNKNFNDFILDMKRQKLEKYMETPILFLQMIGLWFDGESFGKSQCEIYCKMIEKQIQFAAEVKKVPAASSQEEPHSAQTKPMPKQSGLLLKVSKFAHSHFGKHRAEGSSDEESRCTQLPACFYGQRYCKAYQQLLLKLSKLAYNHLFGSQNSTLVFDHDQMEIMGLSEKEIQSCLDLGLLTQYKVLGKTTRRQKSISFIHKSHQEYFAAIYLWQTSNLKELLDDFADLDRVLQVEKVFMFVSGMNPDLSCQLARVIMTRASADPRIKQYRESCLWNEAPHDTLVQQIQGMILAAIEESRSNGRTMPTILLHDIWMRGTHRDFQPSRILECSRSLDLSHVRSIYIDTPSDRESDELWRLVKGSSQQLYKIILRNYDNNASRVTKVLKRNRDTLQTIGLYYSYIDALDISLLNQRDITRILSPNSLGLHKVNLRHEQLEFLYMHLGSRQYREIKLSSLHCQCHGNKSCTPRLDLTASTELRRLQLYNLPVQDVVFVPNSLLWCEIGKLPNTAATRALRSLAATSSLETLYCNVEESVLEELARILPQINTLRYIVLRNIDLGGQQQIDLRDMQALEHIELWDVKLTATSLRQLMAALPSHKVFVAMGHNDNDWPVTITDNEGNRNITEEIAASPNTEVDTKAKVTCEYDKCVIKVFKFYHTK